MSKPASHPDRKPHAAIGPGSAGEVLGFGLQLSERAIAAQVDTLKIAAEAAKAAFEFTGRSADRARAFSHRQMEDANAALRAVAATTTPAEFMSAQTDAMRASAESVVTELIESNEAALVFADAMSRLWLGHVASLTQPAKSSD